MNTNRAVAQLKKIETLAGTMRLAAEQWKSYFQTLIAIVLSARSRDETTIDRCTLLFELYPNAYQLSKANQKEIEKIIYPINFFKNKSKHIKACALELLEKYNGEPPLDYEKLVALTGVGNKTANVFLSEFGKNAIGVDTHVSYISRYLHWSNNKKPHEIEKDLKQLFPVNYWRTLNPALVKFGKRYTSRKEKNKILDEIKEIK